MDRPNWRAGVAFSAGYVATELNDHDTAADILIAAGLTCEERLYEGLSCEFDVKNCAGAFEVIGERIEAGECF